MSAQLAQARAAFTNCPAENYWNYIGHLEKALAAFEAAPQQAQLEKERAARQEAQSELARYKGLLASSRLDLMREMKDQGWTAPQQAQAPDGLSRSDAESWVRHRAGIIEACRAEGYTIVTNAQGVQLMKLGKIAAQAPGWRLARVSDGDIRVYGPDKETWLIRKDCGEGFYDFIYRYFEAAIGAAPQQGSKS